MDDKTLKIKTLTGDEIDVPEYALRLLSETEKKNIVVWNDTLPKGQCVILCDRQNSMERISISRTNGQQNTVELKNGQDYRPWRNPDHWKQGEKYITHMVINTETKQIVELFVDGCSVTNDSPLWKEIVPNLNSMLVQTPVEAAPESTIKIGVGKLKAEVDFKQFKNAVPLWKANTVYVYGKDVEIDKAHKNSYVLYCGEKYNLELNRRRQIDYELCCGSSLNSTTHPARITVFPDGRVNEVWCGGGFFNKTNVLAEGKSQAYVVGGLSVSKTLAKDFIDGHLGVGEENVFKWGGGENMLDVVKGRTTPCVFLEDLGSGVVYVCYYDPATSVKPKDYGDRPWFNSSSVKSGKITFCRFDQNSGSIDFDAKVAVDGNEVRSKDEAYRAVVGATTTPSVPEVKVVDNQFKVGEIKISDNILKFIEKNLGVTDRADFIDWDSVRKTTHSFLKNRKTPCVFIEDRGKGKGYNVVYYDPATMNVQRSDRPWLETTKTKTGKFTWFGVDDSNEIAHSSTIYIDGESHCNSAKARGLIKLEADEQSFKKFADIHKMPPDFTGAAYILEKSTKEWWLNGQLHREDGPAYEDQNGYKEWWLNGIRHTEGSWQKAVAELKNGSGTIEESKTVESKTTAEYKRIAVDGLEISGDILKFIEKNLGVTNQSDFFAWKSVPKDNGDVREWLKKRTTPCIFVDNLVNDYYIVYFDPATMDVSTRRPWCEETKSKLEKLTWFCVDKDKNKISVNSHAYIDGVKTSDNDKIAKLFTATINEKPKDNVLLVNNWSDVPKNYTGEILHSSGTKQWWLNGERHRVGGPAFEESNKSKAWWIKGERHRVDGPAVEYTNGHKEWWLNGELHREDGPAIERVDGSKEWYLNGQEFTESAWKRKMVAKTLECVTINKGIVNEVTVPKEVAELVPPELHHKFYNISKPEQGLETLAYRMTVVYNSQENWSIAFRGKEQHEYFVIGSHGNELEEEATIDKIKNYVKELGEFVAAEKAKLKPQAKSEPVVLELKNIESVPNGFSGIIVWEDGTTSWWFKNQRHREDGPAVEEPNGHKEWWLNGKEYAEENWQKEVAKLNANQKPLFGEPVILKVNIETDIPKNFTGMVLLTDETKQWYLAGKLHREDGPAIEWPNGDKTWFLNGERHRVDGPAFEGADGYKAWWLYGLCHREDGPAKEFVDGHKEWWLNGKLHREDGPAYEGADGSKSWWLNGDSFTEEHWKLLIANKTKIAEFVDVNGLRVPKLIAEAVPEEFHNRIVSIKDPDLSNKISVFNNGDKWSVAFRLEQARTCLVINHENLMLVLNDATKKQIQNYIKEIAASIAAEKENTMSKMLEINSETEIPSGFTGCAKTVYGTSAGKIAYYKNGKLHHESGPAVIYAGGRQEHYLEGKLHTFENWLTKIAALTAAVGSATVAAAVTVIAEDKKEQNTMSKLDKIKTIAISDSREVAKRLAVAQISQVVQKILTEAMSSSAKTKAQKTSVQNSLNEFFVSDKGKAVLQFFMGVGLPFISQHIPEKYHSILEEVATEFRVQGETTAMLEVIEAVTPLLSVMTSSLTSSFGSLDSFMESHVPVRVETATPVKAPVVAEHEHEEVAAEAAKHNKN